MSPMTPKAFKELIEETKGATKEPWIVDRTGRFVDSPNRGKTHTAIGEVGRHGIRLSQIDLANGRLIASAPTLRSHAIQQAERIEALEKALRNIRALAMTTNFNGSTVLRFCREVGIGESLLRTEIM